MTHNKGRHINTQTQAQTHNTSQTRRTNTKHTPNTPNTEAPRKDLTQRNQDMMSSNGTAPRTPMAADHGAAARAARRPRRGA